MEATSARMAARDRFGAMGDPGPSPLQRYIQSACDPQNYEPNLALVLDIADMINAKKGNAPREASVAIVNYINHRNPNVSLLALALLDSCVKNCGYPFHLQIGTKEFLNELVRRFPERPPVRPSRVQLKILENIEEWRQTICQNSRYKEDLGFIRDMHRLLSFKGYVFPEVRREDAAVLNPSDNLKSAEEMEEEEKAAQSAKLQELIRRGGPEDLQEANRLMKVMAGYDTKNRTNYRAKAAEEVGKVQQKAKLLEEMLQGHKRGDELQEGDVFQELANALQSAQPKIQKMCEEESDDSEAVAKLLEINDSIHRTVERYKLVKAGDLEAASQIPIGTLGTSTGVSKTADNELSLIDLSGDVEDLASSTRTGPSAHAASKQAMPSADLLQDDLLGLSFEETSYGLGGGIALGLGSTSTPPVQKNRALTSIPGFGPPPQSNTRTPPQSGTPPPSQQTRTLSQIDPFASISSMQARRPAPSTVPTTQNSLNSSTPQPGKGATPSTASAEDEWQFASSLPASTNELVLSTAPVNIVFSVTRPKGNDNSLLILGKYSNATTEAITDITFEVAVTKAYTLQLKPQSGRHLLPNQKNGITQEIALQGVAKGMASKVRMRFKVSYTARGVSQAQTGQVDGLGDV